MASASIITQKMNSVAEEVLKNPIEFAPAKGAEQSNEKPDNYIKIVPKTPIAEATKNKEKGNEKSPSVGSFYDINEINEDRGCREKSRIVKSWKQVKKPPVGLLNRGVTCYMNSAIQVIFHIPAMAHYLQELTQTPSSAVARNSVSMELAALYQRCIDENSKKKYVYPSKLISRLFDINCMMSEWDQEDSHEYFMSLINRLQEDSTPKGSKLNTSIIHEILGGALTQKVECQNCNEVSTTQQDFMDLPISFSSWEQQNKRSYTVERSIKEYFSPEIIKPDEKKGGKESGYNCEKCKQISSARKEWRIDDAPEYLTVHIKRFAYADTHSKKVKDAIAYPMDLDLTQYSIKQTEPVVYRLNSVLVHEGRTVASGHYIAYCRQPNGKWAEYDDECVRSVPMETVLNQSSAYMLVYSRLLPKKSKNNATNEDYSELNGNNKRPHRDSDDDSDDDDDDKPANGIDGNDAIDKIFSAAAFADNKRSKKN